MEPTSMSPAIAEMLKVIEQLANNIAAEVKDATHQETQNGVVGTIAMATPMMENLLALSKSIVSVNTFQIRDLPSSR
jgi:hypothetical protein